MSRKVQEKRLREFGHVMRRRGLYRKKSDDFGSTSDEVEGQAKATMDGHNQGEREREKRPYD